MSRKTQRYSKKFKAETVRAVLENQLSINCSGQVDHDTFFSVISS